ncbi:3-dehydroquinate synthase [Thalassobacillus hwangdonensis]|uniref:3-dehydroquinate synthase n=1 Tax=Thalassobacillus hwangdonensis TaxID=546108 RepID=A0ABW3KZ26_9BACI
MLLNRKELIVKTNFSQYPIQIGNGLRHEIGSKVAHYQNVLIVTDKNVAPLYLDEVKKSFSSQQSVASFILPAGEASKSMEWYSKLLDACIAENLDRKSLIIALGGGVVGDLAGFVAATYMRGIDYVQMPTTLLAHDSSVGGKVAINHPEGKNMIGSFHHPVLVLYDIDMMATLPHQEVRSGYAEIIKEACLDDQELFMKILSIKPGELIENQGFPQHLYKGMAIKASIVEIDEKEYGVRKYLNFGHTLGHAIETELGYGKITHGEAVAVGMLFAMWVSERIYGCSLPIQELKTWMKHQGYPIDDWNELENQALISRMKKDKKALDGMIHMVLLKEIGSPSVQAIDEKALLKHLQDFRSEYLTFES